MSKSLTTTLLLGSILASTGQAQTTSIVSLDSAGGPANSFCWASQVSADGSTVVFESAASDLVSGDTNWLGDVFARDLATGQTTRVSVSSTGAQGQSWSTGAAVSGDGRYVSFTSFADNLVPGDTNGMHDVFVHDRSTGLTTRVNVGPGGVEANGDSGGCSISEDGRFVAFSSTSTNLVADDTNGLMDVFVHDRLLGTTVRVSLTSDGGQTDTICYFPLISGDGQRIVYTSSSEILVPDDTNEHSDVFVYDIPSGELRRVSVSSAGAQANHLSVSGNLSRDGRLVTFTSAASNLVYGDRNGSLDVFVHDLVTGQTTLASRASDGSQANLGSETPRLSPCGRFVAYRSWAENIVENDGNGVSDVFLHDRYLLENSRLSVSSDGSECSDHSVEPSLSEGGRVASFTSWAEDLVDGDTNELRDVFARETGLEVLGDNYCSAPANSTGLPALLSAVGSASLADDELTLHAERVPDQPFLFFHGQQRVEVPFGDGYLCTVGSVRRLGPPSVAHAGVAERVVDLATSGIGVGTFHFQCWYRDPLAAGAGFNLSDGLEIVFEP